MTYSLVHREIEINLATPSLQASSNVSHPDISLGIQSFAKGSGSNLGIISSTADKNDIWGQLNTIWA